MRLTITIDLDGAAFEDNGSAELKGILSRATRDVCPTIGDGAKLRDSNGNTCGEWKVSE